MKTIKMIILVAICCLMVVGCATTQSTGGGYDASVAHSQMNTSAAPLTTAAAPVEPVKRNLTMNDVENYFMFKTEVEDIKITDEPLGNERGKGKLVISVGCKKKAEFENIVLTLRLVTNSSGWGTLENREIQLSYNGSGEHVFNIYSYIVSYVSDSPIYKVEITGVSGYVIE